MMIRFGGFLVRPPVRSRQKLRLRVVDGRTGMDEMRFRLRTDDQAPAALDAEERAPVAPVLVELQPDERQFRSRLFPGREYAGSDAERHAPGVDRFSFDLYSSSSDDAERGGEVTHADSTGAGDAHR